MNGMILKSSVQKSLINKIYSGYFAVPHRTKKFEVKSDLDPHEEYLEKQKELEKKSLFEYRAPPVDYSRNIVAGNKADAYLEIVNRAPIYYNATEPDLENENIHARKRGYEEVHNKFLYEQYGVVAQTGGTMEWAHFEGIRKLVQGRMDWTKAWAVWRVEAPWFPCTRPISGRKLSRDKPPTTHFETPIRAGRVLLEIGGQVSYKQVFPILRHVVHILPFRANAVSKQDMDEKEILTAHVEKLNLNPYNYKYIVQNNIFGSHDFVEQEDRVTFGKTVA